MVDAGSVKTRRWVLGAVLTALCSLAYAKVPQGPRGGGGGGFAHAGFQHEVRNISGNANTRIERGVPVDRNVRIAHAAAGAHGGYNVPQPQRMAGGGAYRGDSRPEPRNGYQYAGSITPVSAETHSVPRPPEDESMVRAGSIRADIARYNEERGASRQMPRPPDEYMQRPPPPSPYRN
jgi:hypothetical protein